MNPGTANRSGPINPKRRVIVGVFFAIIACWLAWVALRPSEPLYRGRTMSSWMNSPDIMDSELAIQVWTGFGSNAVPFLRRSLHARDGSFKKAYWAVRRHMPRYVNRRLMSYDPPPAAIVRGHAADGLGFLGKAALPAIPDLIHLSKTDQDGFFSKGFVRGRAVAAIGNIGQYLEPPDPSYDVVTDALIEALKDPDPDVRSMAANSLEQQFPEAAAKAGLK